MNVVNLLGRVGRDPEISYAQSGTAVCKLSLATNKKIKGEDKTSWHRLVSFGKTAELIEKYIGKGDQLGVEGEISYGQYDKDGVTMYTTDIIVNRIHFVGGGNGNRGQGGGGGYQNHGGNQGGGYGQQNQGHGGYGGGNQGGYTGGPDHIPDDDIPF